MFTLEQIKSRHAKVKSGADFPAYVVSLIELGVKIYWVYVEDGHSRYEGAEGFVVESAGAYERLFVNPTLDKATFQADLRNHQQGNTDYFTFCEDCAKSGIYRWKMDLESRSCTYYDLDGLVVFTELIPG